MHILLVHPPCRTATIIPLGLGYIASALRENGHKVSLMDLNFENKSFSAIEKDLARLEYDIIGIGGLSTTYNFVKDFSNLAKKIKPKVKIIAGNMVSTASPELLLQNSQVDICVINEGEETLKELVYRIKNFPDIEGVKGIVFKKNEQIIVTNPRERIKNLDKLPLPAWDLFSMEYYVNEPILNEYGRKSISVSTARGCPFQCIYCSRPFGSLVYKRSVENIIAEIKTLIKRYKIKFVAFSDNLFVMDKNWVREFCDALLREKIKIGWTASARLNLVDMPLLRKMKKAGCEALGYGFESGSQKILDNMKKGINVAQAERAVALTRKAGISVDGSFMIGMIGETKETVNESVDFIKRTGLTLHRFFYTTPYPKTALYEMARKMNRIPDDEDKYVGSLGEMYNTPLVNLTDMTDEELKSLKEKAERKIRENFSLRTRMEILHEDLRRISANIKKRIKTKGILATLSWSLGKISQRLKIKERIRH
ncbi:MAG: B12-binding domain-containing radical SAM protein [Candidatus Omnitrophota bacterium]|nr:MAG: B12-binding domain-containing radical SAM protein [Candidatus Omnitrophota bacterium]